MTHTSSPARAVSRVEFIALIAGLMALNALAIDVMLPALPYMGEALGVSSENERQFVITAYTIGFGFAQLAYGPLSDRFGRRAPLMIGMLLYIVCAFAAVFAPNFAVLLLLRALQGVGAASTRVIATSIVRDRFSGRDMAEVMSLVFMVFMVIPIIAPGLGQILLLTGPWQYIFIFMGVLATVFGLWAFFRLPETLHPEFRRGLSLSAITDGFRIVFTNRSAMFYGLAGMFMFGSIFGFISSSQQVFVDIYGFGPYFPLVFAGIGVTMAVASFLNSRMVRTLGMRRLSHSALILFVTISLIFVACSLAGPVSIYVVLAAVLLSLFVFGWASSNMNSLSMEPLGSVAGTAASVFGFTQTVGGAICGTIIGQSFNGTVMPIALGNLCMGGLALICVLIAEKGRLFGVGSQYAGTTPGSH